MNILRRFGLGLTAMLFSLVVFSFAVGVSAYMVFDTPKPLKKALSHSGVYAAASDTFLHQKQDGNLPADDPLVQAAVKQTLTPVFIQENAEKIIDSTYAWMHGTTKTPEFAIDLQPIKASITESVVSSLAEKLNGLPPCSTSIPVPNNPEAIFNLTCRPKNIPTAALVDQVRGTIQDKALTSETTLSANTLKDDNGKTLTQKLHRAPDFYHYFVLSLFALPVVILLLGLLLVFGSSTRRAGIKRVSYTFLTTGLYSIGTALVVLWLGRRLAASASRQTNGVEALQTGIVRAADSLAADLRMWWLGIGVAYLALAAIGLATAHYLGKKRLQTVAETENSLGHNADIPSAGTTFSAERHAVGQNKNEPKK